MRRRRSPKLLAPLAALVLTAAVLAGCTGGGAGSSASDAAGAGAVESSEEADSAPSADAGGGSGDSGGGAVAAEPAAATDRQVVTTGDVTLVVDDPRGAVDEVVALVEGRGGRVDERSEQGAPGGPAGGPGEPVDGAQPSDGALVRDPSRATASLTVRVPAGEVTATIDALGDLGEVESVAVTSSDVTAQARDLDARVSALQASTARLESLITDAATTADVLAAEQALSDRQGSLESLVAERAALGERVDLSTLRVQLVGATVVAAAALPGPQGFLDGLVLGWNALLSALGGLLVVVGVLAPWLVVLGAAGAAVVAVRRRRRRRTPAGATPA